MEQTVDPSFSDDSEDESSITFENVETEELRALNLLKDGKCKDASNLFSDILQFRTSQYGETGIECAETYFNYGKALLMCAKSEYDALGNVIKKDMEKEILKKLNPTPTSKGPIQLEEDSSEEDEIDEPSKAEIEGEAVETLELAWQVLEVARVIYSKHPSYKKNLAEVYLCIGDVGLESDNMQSALTDYLECLKLCQEIYPKDHRKLAEVNYLVGVTYQFMNDNVRAVEHLQQATHVLESKLASPEIGTEESEDIKSTLLELKNKLDEVSDSSKEVQVLEQEKPKIVSQAQNSLNSNPTTQNLPVKNLGTFGRRAKTTNPETKTSEPTKRKSDSETEDGSKRHKAAT